MPKICQITIIKTEEPVDAPRGEVFKVTVFNEKEVVDCWYFADLIDAMQCVQGEMQDLVAI